MLPLTTKPSHHFNEADIPQLLQKIFQKFDADNNRYLTRVQFPLAIKTLVDMVGGEEPSQDDISDIFNLLDVNGDETLDKKQFTSLLITFFKVLKENNVNVFIVRDTDILY